MVQIRVLIAGFALIFLSATAAFAQEVSLPGGATTLNETHGDWTVACMLVAAADGGKTRRCVFSQQQISQETRQRALAIELRPENEGAKGVLILPFGLALAAGVTYQLDDGAAGAMQSFRTCVPAGCIVDIAFDAGTIASLKANKTLKVNVTADGGQPIELSIPLMGFSSAYDRAATLGE